MPQLSQVALWSPPTGGTVEYFTVPVTWLRDSPE